MHFAAPSKHQQRGHRSHKLKGLCEQAYYEGVIEFWFAHIITVLPIYLEYQNTPPLPPLNLKQLECITTPSPSAHYLPRPVKSSSDNRDQHTCRVTSPVQTFSYKRWPLGFGSFGNIWIEYIQIYPNPHMRINISEI